MTLYVHKSQLPKFESKEITLNNAVTAYQIPISGMYNDLIFDAGDYIVTESKGARLALKPDFFLSNWVPVGVELFPKGV